MTRDERIAAGWVESWGLYDYYDRKWMHSNAGWYVLGSGCGHVRLLLTLKEANDRANSPNWSPSCRIVPRIVWRRKKAKAPPPLKVGDEVVVRGRVNQVLPNAGIVSVETKAGYFNVADHCVERVKP